VTINALLLVGFLAFFLLCTAVEAYTVAKGLPTISERIQRAGRSAPLIAVIASFLCGALLIHFFG
jgi:hypothetical protein